MKQYLELGRKILADGASADDRTGVGTFKIFGDQMEFDLSKGFPLVTTTQSYFRSMVGELLALLEGTQDNNRFKELKCSFWDRWTLPDGRNGNPYASAWRAWKTHDGRTIDQIDELLNNLKTRPDSRRHVVTAWDPATLPDETVSPHQNIEEGRSSLAACHCMFQLFVQPISNQERMHLIPQDRLVAFVNRAQGSNDVEALDYLEIPKQKLSLKLYQRSADFPVGVPMNIASYSLLLHMLAQCLNMVPHRFIWSGGDIHVYSNQVELFKEQLQRSPKPLPKLIIKDKSKKDLLSFTPDDFALEGYEHHPKIVYPVAT